MLPAKLSAALALTAVGFISTGCVFLGDAGGPRVVGSGPVVTDKRPVPAFSRIRVGMGTTIEIEVGQSPSVEIEAQDNIAKVIETKVDGVTLSIDTDTSFSSNSPIKLRIKTPTLEGITILGSADVRANKFSSKSLDLAIHGSGDIVMEGSCEELSVVINGSGSIDLSKFAAKTATVDINGAGNIHVNVKDSLGASIDGSGSIVYSGKPKVTEKISGAGSVDPA